MSATNQIVHELNKSTRLPWYRYSATRISTLAIITAFVGYIAAATFSIQSIDQLLHLIHDDDVEWSLREGLDHIREGYSFRQELLIRRLDDVDSQISNISDAKKFRDALDRHLKDGVLGSQIQSVEIVTTHKKAWLSKQQLQYGNKVISFEESRHESSYRKSEAVLQRYKVIGLELRNRIRPALIRSLSVTLAVTFLLLIAVFVIGTSTIRRRVRLILAGFEKFSEGHEEFRFHKTPPDEFGAIEDRFNTMADELTANRKRSTNLEKLASWQTIARKMAHEIKNPLTPIQIMIGQIKRNYRGDDDKFRDLIESAHKVIHEEVAGLRRMVDDFSEFAQLPQAKLIRSDLRETLQNVAELSASAYLPHSVILNVPRIPVLVSHDKTLIRNIIHNLVKNAAEADPKSDRPISIVLIESQIQVAIEVIDEGPGIPSDLQSTIFEAYVTTKHTGPSPGMGLGLAICQKVVLEHNGNLTVNSRPGRTVFRIELPVKP